MNGSSALHRRGRWTATAGAWDVAEFAVDGVDLHMQHSDDQFVASAGASEPLPPRRYASFSQMTSGGMWCSVMRPTRPR
jgi:hypothetical protein